MGFAMMSWLLAIPLLGLTSGLRSMTPMAMLCWFSYAGYLSVEGTWAAWTARLWVAIVFTVLAVAELIADKLPKTPSRTAPGPLLWRLLMGGLAGAIAATAMSGPGLEGVLLSVVAALAGAFAGFMIRRDLVEKFMCADWPVALAEDMVTIWCAGYALHIVAT